MAKIESAKLDFDVLKKQEKFIFKVDVSMRFEERELGTWWLLTSVLKEEDNYIFGRDDRLLTSSEYVLAGRELVSEKYNIPISMGRVDTEWGKEEVYVHLKLIPLESPPPPPPQPQPEPYRSSAKKTNVKKVDI
jgi:hypothetical protein